MQLDLRVVAATNRDLEARVAQGAFRQDLLFRLNVFPITVPPLRARRVDIPALVQHFVEQKVRKHRLTVAPRVVAKAMDRLMAYHWPGNVRELENAVERELILHPTGPLSFDWLRSSQDQERAPEDGSKAPTEPQSLTLDEAMSRHIERVLETTDGRIAGAGGAAERLGLHPNTLRSKMKKLGLR